jgi:hypothetical protein
MNTEDGWVERDTWLRAAVTLVLQVRGNFTLTATEDVAVKQLADAAFYGCRARRIPEGDYLAPYLTRRMPLHVMTP